MGAPDFARYSQDRSFVVLGENRGFVFVMAAGSILGSFIGGQLLGVVPSSVLLPLLTVILVLSAVKPNFPTSHYNVKANQIVRGRGAA